ncbi:MAG: hypothetical protein J6U28_08835 [Bacteroidales bacterium]|nr:hypothetical protein [Bacteroidales bacterium]MBP5775728.1 hypothetical protein [Clostridiales bacterium]
MNSNETNLKPVLNYSIVGMDRPNWFTNEVDNGTAELMFPASIELDEITSAIEGIMNCGYIKRYQFCAGGEESDHNISLVLTDYENYKIVLRELLASWDLCPIASVYTPSRKELGI